MPSILSKEDVEAVAALAHLALTADEKTLFVRQLAEILRYATEVQELDTRGVAPTSHALVGHPADRPDEVRASVSRAEALANAPDPAIDSGLFKVPRVIG